MRIVTASLLVGLLLSAAAQLAGASETAWQTVSPQDFIFSALMPEPTTVETSDNDSILGNTRSTIYHAQTGATRFSVSVTEIPRVAAWLAPLRILYGQARSRLLESTHGTEESFDHAERMGIEGRRLIFNTVPPDEGPRQAKAEFYFIDGRLLVLEASHPLRSNEDALERFFASIHLDREECRHPPTGEVPVTCRVDRVPD